VPLIERIKKHQAAIKAMGPVNPESDMKKFMDEGWSDI
jgi:antitoxin VapB